MSDHAAHPSDYALDRGGSTVSAHLATCEPCRARAGAAELARRRFEEEVLPTTWPVVLKRAREALPSRPARRRWLWLALPLAGAAAIVLVARGAHDPVAPYFGSKGSAATFPFGIEIHVKRDGEVFLLSPGQKIQPGDALRLVYRGERPQHLAVRIVDRARAEQPFHPPSGPAPRIDPGGALPDAAVVDDDPGPDVIVVYASEHPFDSAAPGPEVNRQRIVLEKAR
jgi:hypothetical protein